MKTEPPLLSFLPLAALNNKKIKNSTKKSKKKMYSYNLAECLDGE